MSDRPERLRDFMTDMVKTSSWNSPPRIMSMHETPGGDIFMADAGIPTSVWMINPTDPASVLEKFPNGLVIRQELVRQNLAKGYFGWAFIHQAWGVMIGGDTLDEATERMDSITSKYNRSKGRSLEEHPERFEMMTISATSSDGSILMAALPRREDATLPRNFEIIRVDHPRYASMTQTRIYKALAKADRTTQRIGAGK